MADVAKAGLLLVPRIDNLESTISGAVKKAAGAAGSAGSEVGEKVGSGFGGGLVKSGVVIGAFSELTRRAMDSIASHVGDAVSRFDTLNQYPKTMETLGYSAEDAEASISKMSDRLSTLPTRLDDMTSTVQGIVAITGDLDQATDAGLALNDMLVASGSSTQLTTAAMEQFRQMLAKGKPEMEDWKSLTSAMPGQMAQLAHAMLGPTATANDLYAALGGGKNDPIFTMDQLIDKMIELDTKGGDGITSFKEQAETAAGGVQTSIANMENAITKGLANTMEAIGQDNIAGVFDDIKSGINDALGTVNSVVSDAMPAVREMYDAIAPMAPQAIAMVAAYSGLKTVGTNIADVAGKAKQLAKNSDGLAGANRILGTSFSPVSLGITAVSAALAVGVTAYLDYTEKQKNLETATKGLNDVVSDTTALDTYAGTISRVGESSGFTAMSVDELAESTAKHVETMRQTTEDAEAQISELNTAQSIIDQYAGKTDLSADAQGRLEWAVQKVNEQFGLSITAADVASGKYEDQNGKVQDLKKSVDELVESKKREIQADALSSNYSEALQVQQDAANAYAQARQGFIEDESQGVQLLMDKYGYSYDVAHAAWQAQKNDVDSARDQYESATQAVSDLENEMGDLQKSTSDSADAFDKWGNSVGPLFTSTLNASGFYLTDFKQSLRELGVDTEGLSKLSEEQLIELADSYAGTTDSIKGKLKEFGVGMSSAADGAKSSADEIKSALSGMGDELASALSGSGVSVDDFAKRLSDAGVSTEKLNEIGSYNLSQLAVACNGSIDAMIWGIENYNGTPLLDKDGNVQVDKAQLVDAQGNVYTWNGTQLLDKDGNVQVDEVELLGAQGHVYTWNGTKLSSKSSFARVSGNAADGSAKRGVDDASSSIDSLSGKSVSVNVNGNYGSAADKIWDVVSAIGNLTSKSVTEQITTIRNTLTSKNAAGGIRLNAEGGLRLHAGGAIATRAVPLDIVGEDGAEAIVPLTNRRYSQPFVDLIAEGVNERGGRDDAELARLLRQLHSDLSAIYGAIPDISGRDFDRRVRSAMYA